MDRQIVYPGALPQDTDFLLTNKNTMVSIAALTQAMLGTSTLVDGLACAPTGPAGMTVNISGGSIYSLTTVDATAYGSIIADTTDNIVKQGIILGTTNFSCPAPVTTGQSVVYLVEASFQETDGGSTVLPYYNAANPAAPYNGPNNTGTSNNTVRQGKCVLQLKTGVPATTGSQTIPAADAGFTGLWAITVANGQTTITSGNISAISGAPFISEKLQAKISQATGDARYLQIANQLSYEATDTGTANHFAATLSPVPSAYGVGMRVSLLTAHANTGACDVNFNSLGAKSIKKIGTSGTLVDPASGEIPASVLIDLEYDGTVFEILSRLTPSTTNPGFGATTNLASATTPDLGSIASHIALMTGTTTITGLGTSASTSAPIYIIRFAGVLTWTYNATSMILPGGANITTAAGDVAIVEFLGSGNWQCQSYSKANGTQLFPSLYLNYAADTGTANAYAVAPAPVITAYAAGQVVTLKPANANTGSSTVAVSGLSTKNVKMPNGSNPPANAMLTTGVYSLVFDGTNFVLQNPSTGISAARLKNSAASGTTGPTYSSGTWNTVPLNASEFDPNSIAPLVSNQFTLQAGTYYVSGKVSNFPSSASVKEIRSKIRNITDSANAIQGINVVSNGNQGGFGDASVDGMFTISSAKVFELQFYTTLSSAAVPAVSSGDEEVFATLNIMKLF